MIEEAVIRSIASQFEIPGELVAARRYGEGHINDTYLASYRVAGCERQFIHQRINGTVFPDVAALMQNIGRVTRHARKKLEARRFADVDRRVLTLVPAASSNGEGLDVLRDADGFWWRTYAYIHGARSHQIADSPQRCYHAARAFGAFLHTLSDLDGGPLNETIPSFHDTPKRLAIFAEAVSRDECHRALGVREDIEHYFRHASLADALESLRRSGIAREYPTHNDTKINNVLIDDDSGEGICVLDLDTVMPGIALYDFGDLVRTATTRAAEDEPDVSKVSVDVPMFAAVARGFIEGAGDLLTRDEIEHFVTAGKVITYEIGMRFLTDHLNGDRYFRTHREGQNLDRARAQFALLGSLIEHEDELRSIVREI